MFRANGDSRSADMYEGLANGAAHLLCDGYTQDDLNELSALMPASPAWLDPRAADFDMHRGTWQVDLGPVVAKCRRTAVELRTLESR